MRMHPLMPWSQFLSEWRETDSFYAQTIIFHSRGLAARSRERMRLIDELLKDTNGVFVPDCNQWDKAFKGSLNTIAMSNEPTRSQLLQELKASVVSGFVAEIYGRKRGGKIARR